MRHDIVLTIDSVIDSFKADLVPNAFREITKFSSIIKKTMRVENTFYGLLRFNK